MNTFQICWIIAGAIVGFWTPQAILKTQRIKTDLFFDFSFMFVGGLIAYTIIR
jgi:hypothetical protein